MQAFRLRPRSGFHFGQHGIDVEQTVERCPSDTLYSALFIESLRWKLPFFSPPANHDDDGPLDPPLLLSSAFPYIGEVQLLPRPQLRIPISESAGSKWLKRLEYVSPTIFGMIAAGGDATLDPYLKDQGRLLMGGKVWVAHADGALPVHENGMPIETFWQVEQNPHVAVDRGQATSNYFQVGKVSFAKDCGLYLLAEERQLGAADSLLALLRYLGDSGLGGRRSAGQGQFTVERAEVPTMPTPESPQRMVLLSRYRPSGAEIADKVFGRQASYGLVRVGGWLQSPTSTAAAQRRMNLRMLSEGSVVQLRPDGSPPLGTICDVRPRYAVGEFPHPVWRYGLAMGVPIGGEA
ncbi:type III-A CRISPR-associated RAMP protein Csm4 [Oscillochloris sp. ZM17-4]|uniref:type III-A CRISPR-associated RAMP protein Csm4 n=1 Tax=Oscillochloris sp. ZM17-4 TaxID=2866714 RepID=UPI001C730B65|nr:type III-A CRISPR-associated RAMP protein Csm4 [Oscillochloris sp. ZM17-4]MBX0330705.1 type III-A CRISPR-associated RAMP protein Csm4 [Oscillochloris sp. ZM17-4]